MAPQFEARRAWLELYLGHGRIAFLCSRSELHLKPTRCPRTVRESIVQGSAELAHGNRVFSCFDHWRRSNGCSRRPAQFITRPACRAPGGQPICFGRCTARPASVIPAASPPIRRRGLVLVPSRSARTLGREHQKAPKQEGAVRRSLGAFARPGTMQERPGGTGALLRTAVLPFGISPRSRSPFLNT
jgi:hypothetical protein